MRVIAGDGARYIAGQKFDLVFANILMRPLIKLAPCWRRSSRRAVRSSCPACCARKRRWCARRTPIAACCWQQHNPAARRG